MPCCQLSALFPLSPTVRQGLKPLPQSESPLKEAKELISLLQEDYQSLFQSSEDDFSYETGTLVPGGFGENETTLPHGEKKEGKETRKKEKTFPLALDKLHFIPSISSFFRLSNPPTREIFSPRWYFFT